MHPKWDLTPVPWDLDPEEFAMVDVLDLWVEGLLLTPGRDPYVSCRGETPETPDVAIPSVGNDTNCRLHKMPSGPFMAFNLSSHRSCGTPCGTGALHGNEDDYMPSVHDNETMDDMDSKTISDGGGPWQCA